MSGNAVTYEVVDDIAIVTLNRPEKRNALNNDMTTGLRAAWERFNAGNERVAILTCAGDDFSVGIELEGLEDLLFERAQYDVLARLLDDLAGRYPIGDIVGHQHVAPGRKLDPGSGFDWGRLRAQLGWPAERFAGASAAPPTVL